LSCCACRYRWGEGVALRCCACRYRWGEGGARGGGGVKKGGGEPGICGGGGGVQQIQLRTEDREKTEIWGR